MKPGRAEWGTFGDQIKDFEELFGSAKKDGATWDPDTSVFLIYFGINDVVSLFKPTSKVAADETVSIGRELLFFTMRV